MLNKKGMVFLQDFIAPFYLFVKSKYELEYLKMNDQLTDSHILFTTSSTVAHGNKRKREIKFQFEIESNQIKKFTVVDGSNTMEAKEIKTVV